MSGYNGHKNWNYWNVALWISNEEPLYRRAVELKRLHGIRKGVDWLKSELPPATPDGAPYSKAALMAALRGLE